MELGDLIGQQHIQSIGIYGKSVKKEWASEEQCYYPLEISKQLLDMVFNKQYGIFYYEPCSVGEAELMIKKFEEKINELKEEWLK